MTRAGLLALALTTLSPLAHAEGRRWIADSNDEVTAVIYGTPESDDMVLSIACERTSKMVAIWFAVEPAPVKAADKMPLALATEGGRVQFTANGSRLDTGDLYSLEAQTPLTPELEKTLTGGGGKLSVEADNRTTDMPLDDAALKGAQEVAQACRKQ
jgi:hypothetical protein